MKYSMLDALNVSDGLIC